MEPSSIPFNIQLMPNHRGVTEHLKPITAPAFYDGVSTKFHKEGLFSTEIFGSVSDKRRTQTFAYIDLNTEIIHPILYKNIEKVAGFYTEIMSSKSYAVWDAKIKQFVPSNAVDGQTGYAFFMKHFKEIDFVRNDSPRRTTRIDVLERYRDTAVYDYLLVIPAGLRDAEEGKNGNLTMDEINDYYRSVLTLAANIEKGDSDNVFNDSTRLLIQRNFNAIYDILFSYLRGKGGGLQGKFFKRKLEHGTRGVMTAAEHNMEDMRGPQRLGIHDVALGLHQSLKATVPLVVNAFNSSVLVRDGFSVDGQVQVINPKTNVVEERKVSPKDKELFTAEDGVNTLINRFEKRNFRRREVKISGGYLAMVYVNESEGTFKIVRDPQTVPEDFKAQLRPITYAELFYYLVAPVIQGLPTWVTRYPVTGDGSTTPNALYLKTTDKGLPLKELGDDWQPVYMDGDRYIYKEWPLVELDFFETVAVHPNKLADMGGDHDGDTSSADVSMTDEAIEEGKAYMSDVSRMFKDGNPRAIFSTDIAKWTCAAMTNPP